MEIIEQIGSYAGLAAIVGLAVLSALYFSQARDVRRLRELDQARGAEAGAGQPAAEHVGPKRPTAAAVPGQGAAGAGGSGEQPAGAPARSGPAPAGGQAAATAEGDEQAAPAPAGNAQEARAGAAPAQASSGAATGAAAASANAGTSPEAPATSPGGPNAGAGRPAPPRLPAPRPGATAAALRSANTPSASSPERPWYRRLAPRYIALIVAGVVVVSAGAIYAVTALTGEGDDTSSADVAGAGAADDTGGPLDPSTITVAVLNGTDVAGLGAQVADTVESAGFQRGNVANATEQASAESAVLYANGARSAARQVGQELDIPQIEPIDEQSLVLAGMADVVVVVGADQAE